MRRAIRWTLMTVTCAVLLAGAPRAQTPEPRTEAVLLAEIAQRPQDLPAYLELSRLYAEQRRFDDAEKMLHRAIAVLQVQKAVAAMPAATTAIPPEAGGVPIRVGGNVAVPLRIRYVEPEYPDAARAAGTQGVVYIEAVIGADGSVTSVQTLRSAHPDLTGAAEQAVRQWRYTPTLLNGVAVPVIMTVTVNFKLG